jgi:hypothetical protein
LFAHTSPDTVQLGVAVGPTVGEAGSMPPITKSLPPHPTLIPAAAITTKINTKITRARMTDGVAHSTKQRK